MSSKYLMQRKSVNMMVADNMLLGSQLLVSLLDVL